MKVFKKHLLLVVILITAVIIYKNYHKPSIGQKDGNPILFFRYNMTSQEFDAEVENLLKRGTLNRIEIDKTPTIIYKMNLNMADTVAVFAIDPNFSNDRLCSIQLTLKDSDDNLKAEVVDQIVEIYQSKYGKYKTTETHDRYYGKGWIYEWTLNDKKISILKWYDFHNDRMTILNNDQLQINQDRISRFTITYFDKMYLKQIESENDSINEDYQRKAKRTWKEL